MLRKWLDKKTDEQIKKFRRFQERDEAARRKYLMTGCFVDVFRIVFKMCMGLMVLWFVLFGLSALLSGNFDVFLDVVFFGGPPPPDAPPDAPLNAPP